ncbi:MAG: type II toxin-antitoxin system VapC family toxin [Jatrophihabitantaceae bacterium]
MKQLAFDTSAAIPLLVRSHSAHAAVRRQARGRSPVLTAHSLAETYSVLTRLPGDARLAPLDAVRLIESNFGSPLQPKPSTLAKLPALLAPLGVAGGAVYDALVALAAVERGVPLATRDARALGTYAVIGVEVEVIGPDRSAGPIICS